MNQTKITSIINSISGCALDIVKIIYASPPSTEVDIFGESKEAIYSKLISKAEQWLAANGQESAKGCFVKGVIQYYNQHGRLSDGQRNSLENSLP